MSLELVVLGCSGSGPAPGEPASGYLVRSATTHIWMDAGTGTFMELARHVDPARLDAVFLSHLHADHCADFLGFVHYVAYRSRLHAPIPVFVPPGGVAKLADFLDAEPDHALWNVVAFDEVADGEPRLVGDVRLRFAAASHSVPALSVHAESGGRSLCYSGDTGSAGGFAELATGADVLLCEAGLNPSNDKYQYHLSGEDAGRIASAAGVRRLIVTHLAPTLTEQDIRSAAEAEFWGPIEVASPGLVVAV